MILSEASKCDHIVAMNLDSCRAVAVAIAATVFPTDPRSIGACRGLLPGDAYARAALAIADRRPGQALILTGFPVGGTCETDGPPGAMALGQALKRLGWEIAIVADKTTGPVLSLLLGELGPVETIDGSRDDTREMCDALRQKYSAELVVAVERPGITAGSRLMNMRGEDITRLSSPLDCLMRAPLTVAVGDGGNEIGMGALAPYLDAHDVIPGVSVTRATHLLLSEVSNWGAYGVVAMLDLLTETDALPNGTTDAKWIERLVDAGAVDGLSGKNVATVDGHPLRTTGKILAQLSKLLSAHRGQAKSG